MTITVNLWSKKAGDIKNFLTSYYEKDMNMDEDVDQWIYVYRKPLDSIDMISAIMDNKDKHTISMCIQVDDYDLHPITMENHNDIIRGILCLFYKEPEMQENC